MSVTFYFGPLSALAPCILPSPAPRLCGITGENVITSRSSTPSVWQPMSLLMACQLNRMSKKSVGLVTGLKLKRQNEKKKTKSLEKRANDPSLMAALFAPFLFERKMNPASFAAVCFRIPVRRRDPPQWAAAAAVICARCVGTLGYLGIQ